MFGFDLRCPLRQDLAHSLRYAGHVGRLFEGPFPGDTETSGQLGSEGGVVYPADGALLLLEEPGIQRQPPPGRVLHLRCNDGVGVELRVDRPRRVLPEQRSDDAFGVDLVDAVSSPSSHGTLRLEPAERSINRSVMCGEHLSPHERVGRQRPQRRHRLRRREGGVEPSGRRPTEPATQYPGVLRMPALQQRSQIDASDLARQPQRVKTSAPPPAGWLVGVEVIVDRPPEPSVRPGPVLDQPGVVVEQLADAAGRHLQRLAPHHRHHPARGRANGRAGRNAPVCAVEVSMYD